MKRTVITLSIVLILLVCFQFLSMKSTVAADNCKLYFDLYYESNVFSNLYSVDIYLDDLYVGKVGQGNSYTSLIDTQTGDHTVTFYKSEDKNVYGR